MTDILSRQIQQRADNSSRLSQLISATKGKSFEEHQEDVQNKFNDSVNKYTTKVNAFVQEKLADKEESVQAIMGAPMAYSFAKKSTKNAFYLTGNKDKIKNKVLDDIKNADKKFQDIKDTISGKATQFRNELQQRVNSVRSTIQSRVPQATNNTDDLENGLLGFESGPISEPSMTPMTGPPEPSILQNVNRGAGTNVAERGNDMAEPEPSVNAQNIGNDVTENIRTDAESTLENIGNKLSNLLDKPFFNQPATEEAIAIAPEFAGVTAGAAALGYGVYELFSHHSKKPSAPIRPQQINQAITTPYNIQANILATSGQQLQRGSYAF